ncbi:MAG TPA: DUF1127 domain-containing protein [Burkholderiales bacterium]|nr:DUF1127 domain-containing protein [Burkholderiales bacterium]
MSAAASLRLSLADGLGALLGGARQHLRAALTRYVNARSRAAAIRQLERLSDETLRDIGLERDRIRTAVRRAEMPWS